jgi:hypothetical protein
MQLTPAEQLILRVAREEVGPLEGHGYSWRERSEAMKKAAHRLGLSTERVAQVYDRNRDES